MTAGHAFSSVNGIIKVEVGINRRWTSVKVVAWSDTDTVDIAILTIKIKSEYSKACFGFADKIDVKEVRILAYPGNRNSEVWGCSYDPRSTNVTLIGRSRVAQGMSGGAITAENKLIGILVGGFVGTSEVRYTSASICKRYLIANLGGLPKCGKPVAPKPPETKSIVVDYSIKISKLQSEIAKLKSQLQSVLNSQGEYKNQIKDLISLVESMKLKQGLRGDRGLVGERGVQGVKGIQGLKGDKGVIGPAGPSRTVTIIFQDTSGKELTKPVVIPPNVRKIRVPIIRFDKER